MIVPREGAGRRLFEAAGARFWPRIWNGRGAEPEAGDDTRTDVPLAPLFPGMRCVYMPLPRMDVNATEVRRRWLEGRCLNVLVPDAELALMRKHDALLREIWG